MAVLTCLQNLYKSKMKLQVRIHPPGLLEALLVLKYDGVQVADTSHATSPQAECPTIGLGN